MKSTCFRCLLQGMLLACASCLLSSCIYLPISSYDFNSRHNMPDKTKTLIQAGLTTKEDVVLRFGEPDVVADASIAYNWYQSDGFIIVFIMGGGRTTSMRHTMKVAFDSSNRVSDVHYEKGDILR